MVRRGYRERRREWRRTKCEYRRSTVTVVGVSSSPSGVGDEEEEEEKVVDT